MAGLLEAVQGLLAGKVDREEVTALRRALGEKVNIADHQVRLSVCLSVHLSSCRPTYPPVCQPHRPPAVSVCLCVCVSVCLCECVSVCLCVCAPTCLSVCPSVTQSGAHGIAVCMQTIRGNHVD